MSIVSPHVFFKYGDGVLESTLPRVTKRTMDGFTLDLYGSASPLFSIFHDTCLGGHCTGVPSTALQVALITINL